MGPYRNAHKLSAAPRRKQAGITAISFMLLAAVFGILGFAVVKLVPLYIDNMRMSTVLRELKSNMENQGGGVTAAAIRDDLSRRLDVEDIDVAREDVTIRRANDGYSVRIKHEGRVSFLAGIWFLLKFDKQVEIKR